MQLYHPESYPVLTGKKTNIALCTCWSDPVIFQSRLHNALDQFSIIGSLYSREGVSILIRNLCLNPHINTVVIWANSPLSQTPIGLSGHTMLRSIWQYGVDADHRTGSSGEQIHKEIDCTMLRNITQHVRLIDLSQSPVNEMLTKSKRLQSTGVKPYMKSVSFPDPVRNIQKTWPSEGAGWAVHGETIPDVWVRLADRIMRYGNIKTTENATAQKELQVISWTVAGTARQELPDMGWPKEVCEHIGLEKNIYEQYKHIFLSPDVPAGSAYTYGNRLFDFPGKINQIRCLIDHLKKHKDTRQAFATTYAPHLDVASPLPPCLTSVQFLSGKNNTLNMSAYFRSHDIGKAAIPNAYGLYALLQYVAGQTSMLPGSLTITSASAHIYEQDWNIITDILRCAVWERTKTHFDEREDIDPRGIVRVRLKGQKISVYLSGEGHELFTGEFTSAREAILKLCQLDMLSRPDHYADIALELMKAEIAMKSDQQYEQDKAIRIGELTIK